MSQRKKAFSLRISFRFAFDKIYLNLYKNAFLRNSFVFWNRNFIQPFIVDIRFDRQFKCEFAFL